MHLSTHTCEHDHRLTKFYYHKGKSQAHAFTHMQLHSHYAPTLTGHHVPNTHIIIHTHSYQGILCLHTHTHTQRQTMFTHTHRGKPCLHTHTQTLRQTMFTHTRACVRAHAHTHTHILTNISSLCTQTHTRPSLKSQYHFLDLAADALILLISSLLIYCTPSLLLYLPTLLSKNTPSSLSFLFFCNSDLQLQTVSSCTGSNGTIDIDNHNDDSTTTITTDNSNSTTATTIATSTKYKQWKMQNLTIQSALCTTDFT